ncbi:MAG: aspartate carbamoyltransferase [Candidatus Micrarchaeota archaeon]|nr:aspartate carbamoyltransferase [Candidatus Micrarchaeota archaeon]MDE1824576.1 aspartate carbamoyltransferase [Candidatus Micrarchaeota archaeon]MDE1849250.1 aspartate carbamoyltransferase [Candidatus Micrarchaeota archaeon]
MKNIISSTDLGRKEIEEIFSLASSIKKGKKVKAIRDKVVALAFFEPSTRTFTSFDVAAKRLGLQTTGFRSEHETSVAKEETFADTIRMLSSYADCLVIRHKFDGAAKFASQITNRPIINAGDGKREHPTQSLIDLYTVLNSFGKIDGLRYGIVGDLKYGRAVHSLLSMLTTFKPRHVHLISPRQLEMPKGFLKGLNYPYGETERLESVIGDVDVLYATRIQKERFPDEIEYNKVKESYRIDRDIVSRMKDKAIILHPLPRVTEISRDVDATEKAKYFEQAGNGVPIRMALYSKILGG